MHEPRSSYSGSVIFLPDTKESRLSNPAETIRAVNCQHCESSMGCPEKMRLAGLSEGKCKAYAYIRLNEGKVGVSKRRYDELVKEGYAAMTAAIKDLGWHEMNCSVCKNQSAK
jgi:hypothetical protein